MDWWIFLVMFVVLGTGIQAGILYPRTSEARESLVLDGIWKFAISNRSEQEKGFQENWYQTPLQQVKVLCCYQLPFLF